MITSHIDIASLQTALLNTISADKTIRKTCELYLSEEKNKPDFLQGVFHILHSNQNNPNSLDVISIIYLKKFFETSYKYSLFFK